MPCFVVWRDRLNEPTNSSLFLCCWGLGKSLAKTSFESEPGLGQAAVGEPCVISWAPSQPQPLWVSWVILFNGKESSRICLLSPPEQNRREGPLWPFHWADVLGWDAADNCFLDNQALHFLCWRHWPWILWKHIPVPLISASSRESCFHHWGICFQSKV